MEKQVIVINGTGGSGKDTFVEFCSEFIKIINISSVDKVKEAAKILVGWDGSKDEISRKLLVDLKQLSIEYNDYPTIYIQEQYDNFIKSDFNILFIHIREINEIKKIKDLLKAKTLLIRNPRVSLITSNNSDKNVYNYTYDYIIENDGTLDDLRKKAKDFIMNI